MLQIGKANEVKFKIDVNGTSAPPAVRIVIGTPEAEIGFKAEKLLGVEGSWFSEVLIPEDLKAGEYDFRVEVVINNRLFTPIKRKVMIGTPEPVMAATTPTPENVEPAHPTQKPKQTETWEGEGGALPEIPEVPQPLPATPLDPLKDEPKKSLMKDFNKPTVKEQKKIISKPAVKAEPPRAKRAMPKKLSSGMPKPATQKAEPIRIKMSEIAAESDKRFEKVLKESASYRKPGVSVPGLNVQHHTPISLKKGEIVYE